MQKNMCSTISRRAISSRALQKNFRWARSPKRIATWSRTSTSARSWSRSRKRFPFIPHLRQSVYATDPAQNTFTRWAVSKPAILSTRPLFQAARTILDEHFQMDYWKAPERIPREELLKRAADKAGLVCLLTEKVDEELLSSAPLLRIASTVSVGYDNIDVAACTKHKVVATNTPGVLDDTTADFAWTLLMAIARRLLEGDAWMRSGTWPGWDLDQLVGGDVW